MDKAKQQLIDKLKTSSNILVTVRNSPSVDQLAACLGLTLLLNKLGKHATAVYSGDTPSTIEFLQPEQTIEKNTDSLQDFIIALDKSKADKLRYKVEDRVVKIFITPYKTSIDENDLEFSHGDFNVDVVVALGVHEQANLDQAITAHGRILHDATVVSVNTTPDGGLGSINWHDTNASSLSELVASLTEALGKDLLDGQIATALLTGIVSETERFSNAKTSSSTMAVSAELMAAGANQQLVATKLAEPEPEPKPPKREEADGEPADMELPEPAPEPDDGTLSIDHDGESEADGGSQPESEPPAEPADEPEPPAAPNDDKPAPEPAQKSEETPGRLMTAPPAIGSPLTANSNPEPLDPATDPLSLPEEEEPLLDHGKIGTPDEGEQIKEKPEPQPEEEKPTSKAETPPEPKVEDKDQQPEPSEQKPAEAKVDKLSEIDIDEHGRLSLKGGAKAKPEPKPAEASKGDDTLADLEKNVDSPHQAASQPALEDARDEVRQALSDSQVPGTPKPIDALNAKPLGEPLHEASPESNGAAPLDSGLTPLDMPMPPGAPATPPEDIPSGEAKNENGPPPPPVPPPMMPPPLM